MRIARIAQLALTLSTALTVLSCGSGSEIVTSDAKVTKAAGDTVPVYRFAKISNGAYFYTASPAEFEQVNAGFPDFRYEGVAFQAVTTGGTPVFRYAKTDTGAYFYTTSVEEKDYIAANFPNFRYEGEAFNVPATTGAPMYRLANLSNGAYLYTSSLDEYNYAQTVGFRGEGEKFKVPGGLLLSGTVFDGVPWAQATVNLIDNAGNARSAVTSSLGNYSLDATGLVPPLAIAATYKEPGAIHDSMLAVLQTLPANATSTTMNITPLTTQIYAFAIGRSNGATRIKNSAGISGTFIPPNFLPSIASFANGQRVALSNHLSANGLSAADFDPVKLPFAANSSGQAALIRDLAITEIGRGYWFANRRSSEQNDAAYLDVTNTTFTTAAPIVLPQKPVFPQSILDTYKAAWKACLAIPAAQRVTLDSAGVASSTHPTCAGIAKSTYLQSGDNFGTAWKILLSHPGFTENSIEHVAFRSYLDINGKETASVYLRALATDGRAVNQLETFRKINGQWDVDGNQQSFNGRIVARTNAQSRIASSSVGAFSRMRQELQFVADPNHPSLAQVRAIRIKGPGLPSAGLVWARSTVCGTHNYFAIHNKTGDVANIQYTDQLAGAFVLSQTGQAWPSTIPINYGDVQLVTAYSTIAPLSQYLVEHFSFQDIASTTPTSTYYVALEGAIKTAFTDFLPILSTTFYDNYMRNNGTGASAQTNVPVEWTTPKSITEVLITSTSLNTAQTNVNAPDYKFITESAISGGWIAAGATGANMVVTAASMKSGTSVNATTAGLAATSNLTCASQPLQIRALSDPSASREIVIRNVMPDLTRMQRDQFWQN